MLQTKAGLFILRCLFLVLGFGMFVLVEAAAVGSLPFWLVVCLLPVCVCVLAQLFFLSIRAPRRKKKHTRNTPATCGAHVVHMPKHKPTAC